jgi:guanyl-specific ribonuclease Sa
VTTEEEQIMARQNKVVVSGKVQKNNNKKFKIKKDKGTEVDVDIEIEDDGEYEVDKLSVDGLPSQMNDGTSIRWFNNFAIKKNGKYINQKYKVKIPGISNLGASRLVIFGGNGDPYYFTGEIVDDTFELTDGDPGIGGAPPMN